MANRFILPATMRFSLEDSLPDRIRCNLTWKKENYLLFHPRLFGDQQDWDLWDDTVWWLEQENYFGEIEHKYMGLVLQIMPKPSESGTRRPRRKGRK